MKQMLKKIYTILILLKNILIRKKKYRLHFIAENKPPIKRWYYDFKHWGFDHGNLEMVAGADTLCELYAKGKDNLTVEIIASRKKRKLNNELYDEYKMIKPPKGLEWFDKIIIGRDYESTQMPTQNVDRMWICPVTLFVLGRYPNYIYIKNT